MQGCVCGSVHMRMRIAHASSCSIKGVKVRTMEHCLDLCTSYTCPKCWGQKKLGPSFLVFSEMAPQLPSTFGCSAAEASTSWMSPKTRHDLAYPHLHTDPDPSVMPVIWDMHEDGMKRPGRLKLEVCCRNAPSPLLLILLHAAAHVRIQQCTLKAKPAARWEINVSALNTKHGGGGGGIPAIH